MGIDTTRISRYSSGVTNKRQERVRRDRYMTSEELERILQVLRDQGRLDSKWYQM